MPLISVQTLRGLSLTLLLILTAHLAGAAPVTWNVQSILKAQDKPAENITKSLQEASVIPDVLPDSFQPTFQLSIAYSSSHEKVSLGNLIPVESTSSRPVFQIIPFDTPSLSPTRTIAENQSYSLALTDPDATSRSEPIKAQMCHWIATGIKPRLVNGSEGFQGVDDATHVLDLSVSSFPAEAGNFEDSAVGELIHYMAPAPPKKTGKHRYVFVLLESKDANGGKEKKLKAPKDRAHWGYGKVGAGVMEWAEDNDLRPVGANFFYAQHKKQ